MTTDNITEYYYFTGPAAYAKVFEHNRDMKGYEDQYVEHDGMYTIMVGLPPEEIDTMLSFNKRYEPKDGSKIPGMEDIDITDLSFLTFKRKHKVVSKKGAVVRMLSGPPKVVNADGSPWPDDKLIGNGSIVTVKVAVSPFPMGRKGFFVRLEGVRVDKLVAFEGVTPPAVAKGPDEGLPF